MQGNGVPFELGPVRAESKQRAVVVPNPVHVDSTRGESNKYAPEFLRAVYPDGSNPADPLDDPPENTLIQPTEVESYLATWSYRAAVLVPPESYGDNPDVQGGY